MSFGDVVLSFDALKEMMIDKLGGAADAGAGSGDGVQDAIARARADARDARDAADAAAHRAGGNGSAGPSGNAGPGGSRGGGRPT